MSDNHPDIATLAHQFNQHHKKVMEFIAAPKPAPAFAIAVTQIIAGDEFILAGERKDFVAFLPETWRLAFSDIAPVWPGCTNWWGGFPIIAILEMKAHAGGKTGFIKLNFEIGPLSDHADRKCLIDTIEGAAHAIGNDRIRFPNDACDLGQLYSRFLRWNSLAVDVVSDPKEIVLKGRKLIADFAPEFELVAQAIANAIKQTVDPVSIKA